MLICSNQVCNVNYALVCETFPGDLNSVLGTTVEAATRADFDFCVSISLSSALKDLVESITSSKPIRVYYFQGLVYVWGLLKLKFLLDNTG